MSKKMQRGVIKYLENIKGKFRKNLPVKTYGTKKLSHRSGENYTPRDI